MTLGEYVRRWQERRTLRAMREEHRAQLRSSSLMDVRHTHLEQQLRESQRNLHNVRARMQREIDERDQDIEELRANFQQMQKSLNARLEAKDDTIMSLRAALENDGTSECELPENVLIGKDIVDSVAKIVVQRTDELTDEIRTCQGQVCAILKYMERAIAEEEQAQAHGQSQSQSQSETDEEPVEPEVVRLREELQKANDQIEKTADLAQKEVLRCQENFKLKEVLHKMRLRDMGKKLREIDHRLKAVENERDLLESQLREATSSPQESTTLCDGGSEVTPQLGKALSTEDRKFSGRLMDNPMYAGGGESKENVESSANGVTLSLREIPKKGDKGEESSDAKTEPKKSPVANKETGKEACAVSTSGGSSLIDVNDDFWRFDSQELESPFNAPQYPLEVEQIMMTKYASSKDGSSKRGSNEISEQNSI